jgi:hypothetical protein
MFICDKCLLKSYTNQPGFGRSFGTCESCHASEACSDIPSSRLRPKKEVVSEPAIVINLRQMIDAKKVAIRQLEDQIEGMQWEIALHLGKEKPE